MEESPSTSVATVTTFYNNLADEVDQHFARALQSTATPTQSQGFLNREASCWAYQATQQMGHSNTGTTFSPSPPLVTINPNSGATTNHQAYSHIDSLAYPPSPSVITDNSDNRGTIIYPEFVDHLVLPDVESFTGPPPLSVINDSFNNSRGTIIHPEFINHLVQPDIDSFKDIPKLPGQTDP